jgi:cytochrome oxidase Cu insertion factor (SCO1/SenC/PrrC family)/uncharacterized membrane protein YozB (DUF420 family)
MVLTTGRRGACAALLCLPLLASGAPPPPAGPDLDWAVGDFTLTDQDGRQVHAADLAGKVWVASFIFTRCGGPCPHVTATMAELQKAFADRPDVRLVTFTVDPEYDTPEVLKKYPGRLGFEADPARWLFLTGPPAEIDRLLGDRFHIGAEKNAGAEPGQAVTHDTHLEVVDRRGVVRAIYPGFAPAEDDASRRDFEKDQVALRRKVGELLREGTPAAFFPPLNAALNAAAGVLLLLGYAAIRGRLMRLHMGLMLAALAVSAVFLASYLYYHLAVMHGRPTYFREQWPDAPGWVGTVYLIVLASHTLLAAVTAPLALVTALFGLLGRLRRHLWLGRVTLPIWLYVSATGVVVYWMLYRLY